MADASYVMLPDRGLLAISGPEAADFLQGVVSNDIRKATPASAVWAAFLTPQGKFLHEFFIVQMNGAYYLECEAARLQDLRKRLMMYRLRSKVEIVEADGYAVAAVVGAGTAEVLGLDAERGRARPLADGVVYIDPRLPALGARAILPADRAEAALGELGLTPTDTADYDARRIALGVPDGSRDLEVEKSTLLENGFDELGGVDWEKGCYLGQELTARTRYRGLVKKRLMPVKVDGPMPAPGTEVMLDGRSAGTVRSGVDGTALVLLRLDAFAKAAEGAELVAGEARLSPRKPAWAEFRTAS